MDNQTKNAELEAQLQEIFASSSSDVEKLAQAYDALTRRYLYEYNNQIELLKAMQDEENLLKERIKHGMLNSARGMFSYCYHRLTGSPAWKDE